MVKKTSKKGKSAVSKKKTVKKSKKAAKKAVKKAAKKAIQKKAAKAVKKTVKVLKKPVKAVARKAKKVLPVKAPAPVIPGKLVGEVTHFYPNISVGVVVIKDDLRVGDTIIISGHGRNFEQKVDSMQVEYQPIALARKGQIIGMKVTQPVKEKDLVYRKV